MHPNIQENISLKMLNTFQVGGNAKYFFEARDKESFLAALEWAEEEAEKVYILGGGSNILVPDKGIDGLVVHMKNDERKFMGERIECGAGASLAQVNSLAVANNLSGLEWSIGIPRATIGGATRGNAEAFGVGMVDIVENVEIYHKLNKNFELLSNRMCKFDYRTSIFKERDKYIIWKVILHLTPSDSRDIQKKQEHALDFRLGKYPRLPSAGSIFANVIPEEMKDANMKIIEKEMEGKINREGNIGAGFLIDIAGLKGKSIGGIKISLEHANHIVNTGKGTSEEVVMMISLIKQQIRTKFNIELKEELQYFGFE
jgi:UDP-N-acetylmuramate dehydrogenase